MPTDMEILDQETPATEAAAAEAAPAGTPSQTEAAAAAPETGATPDAGAARDEFAPRFDAAAAGSAAATAPAPEPKPWESVASADSPLGKLLAADSDARAAVERLISRGEEYSQLQAILPSVEAAQEALQSRQVLQAFDAAYFQGSPEEFLSKLYQAQVQDGQSSGVYERVMQTAHRALFDSLDQHAQATGDEALRNAVAELRDRLPWAQASGQQEIPAHLRGELEAGRRASQQLQQMRAAETQAQGAAAEAFVDSIADEVVSGARAYAMKALEPTAFTAFEREAIADRFLAKLDEMAEADRGYAAALADLVSRAGTGPQARAAILQRMNGWLQANRQAALQPAVTAAAAARKEKEAAAAAKRAGWNAEPRGAGDSGAAGGTAKISGAELEKALREKLHRRPTDLEILNSE